MYRLLLTFLCILCSFEILHAQLKLASLFTDNMVLQQKANVPVWGWTAAGKNVKVTSSWDKKSYNAKADANGKWKVFVSTPAAGGTYKVTISDGQVVQLNNVLVGEVWLCSGQSNMDMPMKGFKGQPVIGSNEAI